MQVLKVLAIALAVSLVSVGCLAGIAVWQLTGNVGQGVHLALLPGQSAPPVPGVGAIEGGVNLLLAGTDTRTGQGANFADPADLAGSSGAGSNDVTMVLHISADHSSASVISIPRDLMTPIPDCPSPDGKSTVAATDSGMFNTTLSRGGLPCVVLTAEKLTGLSIPYAALISFQGVSSMSTAVGGVTVCLATDVNDDYANLHLSAGQQTISGDTALAFVRSRHGVGDGSDLGRISNQQLFLSALVRKIKSGDVLNNPVTLFSLATAATKNMTLSDTLTNPTTLVAIALALKNISLDNVVFVQYPTVADPNDSNRVVANAAAVTALNAALKADQPLQLSGTVGAATQLDPSATAAPTTPAGTPAPTSSGTSTPTPSPTSAVLPPAVTGQTAAQVTCTKGNN
ncbi:LCP family protein [Subtercola sp. RTI3]|uniref:LCP family protein n=1 Tax=Subtercola sp. RTI3 TaxID=3048639 RepID=UPI002B2232B6|nr:LCP family protein [Subtercola sp. RTI3]MEA9984278.1 LCP family protein [Subtercola sp. RTI3]